MKRVRLEGERGPVFVRPDAVLGVYASGVPGKSVVTTTYNAHHLVDGDPETVNSALNSTQPPD
jgi:hypothetical protein